MNIYESNSTITQTYRGRFSAGNGKYRELNKYASIRNKIINKGPDIMYKLRMAVINGSDVAQRVINHLSITDSLLPDSFFCSYFYL